MATSSKRRHVVFDVVGTCFSYDGIFDALDARLGDKLRSQCILPKLLGYAWLEAAEREYTYLSISGRYKVFIDVFEALFWRMLSMAGVEDPRSFATEEDLAFVMTKYQELEARPGIAACFEALRQDGFTVWAFTTGDKARVSGYFRKNGIDMPEENFKSCDSIGIGKPSPEAYKSMLDQFAGEEAWFAAAHMWDVSAARENGYALYHRVTDAHMEDKMLLYLCETIFADFPMSLRTDSKELTAPLWRKTHALRSLGTWM